MYVDEHVLMHEGGNGPGEGKDFYYLLGPLYTVAGLADSEGKMVQSYSYDAYGDVVTTPAPPTVTAGGSRYLLVTPADQGFTRVALVVSGAPNDPDVACVHGYVQSKCSGGPSNGLDCATDADCPKRCVGGQFPGAVCAIATDCPQGACVGSCDEGTLGDTPFYKLSSQWGTAKVRGREIRPGTTYSLYAQSNLGGGASFSSAATAATWTWGDIDHNGVVNVLDVANQVNALKGFWGPFTFEQMNLYGCEPDAVLNALDIVLAVDAVRGFSFPCDPATCGTSNLPPPNPYYFTGRRLDFNFRDANGKPLLALYDYRAREYDARHGRFLQRDPAGYVDGMSLYEAFKSNPLRFLDPEGTKNWEAYNQAVAQHGRLYADFWDVWGFYEYTPPARGYNALADDAEFLIDEIKKSRTQGLKLLGESLNVGVEILGAFNIGADLAIVVDEVSAGNIHASQFLTLLPFIPGEKQLVLLSRCGKVLKRMKGTGSDVFLATIRPWRDLDRLTRGIRRANNVDAHHLIELRFAPRLRIRDTGEIEGVLVDVLLHRGAGPDSITQRLRNIIPHRPNGDYSDVPLQEIYDAHRRVYKELGIPEVMEAINHWFEQLGVLISQ